MSLKEFSHIAYSLAQYFNVVKCGGRLGVAQLVARSVRDAEVARSSRVTQTILKLGPL